ncbi:hypothetical protein KC949_03900, partial [Candidatus Saccharibacteria bacterium]|nr:hypothetical protein [Candidatus Saccharibacteria bacterium]
MSNGLETAPPSIGMLLLIIAAALWQLTWTALAMWRAAERREKVWFVVMLGLQNFLGVPQIIYCLATRPRR